MLSFAQSLGQDVFDENADDTTGDVTYTVKAGDTLPGIALAYYGDPAQAEFIYQANLGREQPNGRQFNRHGLILPGWTLVIPGATQGIVEEHDGATTDEGRQLAPALADALVATARGDSNDESDRQALAAVEQTRTALRQILDWLESLPFDAEDLADIDVAIAACRREHERAAREDEARLAPGGTFGRALGAGRLEWRWVNKPSDRKFGPYRVEIDTGFYRYGRWRDSGRKRSKYIGKAPAYGGAASRDTAVGAP